VSLGEKKNLTLSRQATTTQRRQKDSNPTVIPAKAGIQGKSTRIVPGRNNKEITINSRDSKF
jgi:hypothetical protein